MYIRSLCDFRTVAMHCIGIGMHRTELCNRLSGFALLIDGLRAEPLGLPSFGRDKALLRKAMEMVSDRCFTIRAGSNINSGASQQCSRGLNRIHSNGVIAASIGYTLPTALSIVTPRWGTTSSIAFSFHSFAVSEIGSSFIASALLSLGLALPFRCRALANG